MSNEFLITVGSFSFIVLAGGILLTRVTVAKRQRESLRRRLETMIGEPNPQTLPIKLKRKQAEDRSAGPIMVDLKSSSFYKHLLKIHSLSSFKTGLNDLIFLILTGSAITLCLPFVFELPLVYCLAASVALLLLPYVLMRMKAEKMRNKFLLQLPNAIDLMVSILKSGHSIPQAVRSVAEESPGPCGDEFMQIFHRMNLGQSLPESLQSSVEKYDSFELDLLRRASGLHQEVGGSLAEILEKTNETLRQRIKLKNQIAIMTTQGKLSALVCAALPFFVAIVFSQINPNYLKPLLESQLGQLMIAAALFLELAGFLIMRKLSTFRI